MNPVKEFMTGVALKAAGVNDLPFPSQPRGMFHFSPNQKVFNFRKVGNGLSNSAVSAVLTSMGRAYSEPTVREYERVDNTFEVVEDSEVVDLLATPNPFMDPEMFDLYTVVAIAVTGSAYFHKVRNLFGGIVELWPLYPEFIIPVTPRDGSEFISHWEYTPPGTRKIDIPADDIVQLRWGMNREDFRLGHAPLQDVLIEVLQDHEAAEFSTALLTNLGVPGVILSPKDPADSGTGDPAAIAKEFQSKFTGSKRGQPFVSSIALGVEMVSFSPKDLDLTALRRVPEERISAVLGWPAILAGLGAGLTSTSGRGESATLREDAIESTLIPLWKMAGRQLTRQLLYDKGYGEPDPKRSLQMDLTEVRALKKDEKDEVEKIDIAVTGGWAMVAEARRMIGLPVESVHEVFLRNISTFAVGSTEDATVVTDGEPTS